MPIRKCLQKNYYEDPPQNDFTNLDKKEENEGNALKVVEDEEHAKDGNGNGNSDHNNHDEECGSVEVTKKNLSHGCNETINNEKFVIARLSDMRKEMQCPICLGIIRKTRTVMECLHRFCKECIDKSMRMGNNECPACRTHCASRRSLRDDPQYDALISAIYPNVHLYEEDELAFQEDEKARNKQIQATIAQTIRRQTEALGQKQRRSHGNHRKRRNYRFGDEDDANGHASEKDSSSADEQCTKPKPKPRRLQRRKTQKSQAPPNVGGVGDKNDPKAIDKPKVLPTNFVGTSEMLVWGKGGMRSNTKNESVGVANDKHSQNRFARLYEHLQNSNKNDHEFDIHVKLVSINEQKVPLLQRPYLCARPTLSIGQLSQFIANQVSLPPERVEIFGVKNLCSKLSSLSTIQLQISRSTAFDACREELQILDAKETLAELKVVSDFSRGQLVLAYRLNLV